MGRTGEGGIWIRAKNAVESGMKGSQKVVSAFVANLRRLGGSAAGAFKGVGLSAISLNQGLNLVMKFGRLAKMVIGGLVTAALDYRAANDPIHAQLSEMQDKVGSLKARLGDALLPTIQALADAFGPLIDSTVRWLSANHKLVASGVLEFVIGLGRVLTTVVGKAVLLVARAWLGWQMVIQGTKIGLNRSLEKTKKLEEEAEKASKFRADIAAAQREAADAAEKAEAKLRPQVKTYEELQVASLGAAIKLEEVRMRMQALAGTTPTTTAELERLRAELAMLKSEADKQEAVIDKANEAS